MKKRAKFKLKGLKFVLTYDAFPEQYEVFNKYNCQVGYLRLRHSLFSVQCPDCMDSERLEMITDGSGEFTDLERKECLLIAAVAIKKWMMGHLK
jgi:hypothetical protein